MVYMENMVRKNIHIPDDLSEAIGRIRFDGRFSSETAAIVSLLEGSVSQIKDERGFTYLVLAKDSGLLKIGHSAIPSKRIGILKSAEKQDIEPIAYLLGGRMVEILAHTLWGRYRVKGEWFKDVPQIRKWFADHPYRVEESDLPRSKVIPVTLNNKQHAKLKAASSKAGMAISAFMRMSALEEANE